MSDLLFKSVQAATFKAFVDLKHAQGYTYNTQALRLHRFDRFLCKCSYSLAWLEPEIIENYRDQFSHCTAYSQAGMLSIVRVYSRFLHLRYPQSHVIAKLPCKVKRPSRFYIYTDEEIAALMQAAGNLGPITSIRAHSIKTLIGLLYVSGLRIGEALRLNVDDLDEKERTLFVRKGKFGKDRYVPLAASSVEALLCYRKQADRISNERALFISSRGTRLSSKTIDHIFRKLLRECGIASGKPWPRLHDLRHTFAVGCVCKWYEQGCNVNALLPVLSTVMGHVKVSCTQVYMHVPDRLREQAANRFHQHFKTRIISGK